MRKEFNELVETMKRWDLFQKDDEVDIALNDLGAKIDEVEKRIECAVRSAKEINESISKYTEEIDLSKVPIIKEEVFMTFESSWGEIDCDRDGNVLEIRGDEYICDERSYLYDIGIFDLVEYGRFCESENITMGEAEDILFVGFWGKNGKYNKADEGRRNGLNVFGYEIAPTMLCLDEGKNVAVKDIILKLKAIDVDGETMEYILRQVGMEGQMLKQLVSRATNDDIDSLLDERKELNSI